MNESEIRRAFFYALNEAGAYDATIEWVAPYYQQMHQMMLRLAVESMPTDGRQSSNPLLALDIGSGTGTEAISLLQAFPDLRLLGLDLCGPMNDVFREKAAKANVAENRFHLMEADVLDPASGEAIRREATTVFGSSRFHLIVSAFTLHHLKTDQKAEIFRMIYDLLEPDGIFLLGDLFNYGGESSWLTSSIFNWEISWIESNFEQGAQDAEEAGKTQDGVHLRRLKEQWIRHYMADNKLDGVTTQLAQLRNVGFSEAGNPFRYWQVGLIWAKK